MSVRVIHGDALEMLRTLPDASVQMCVTSPPFFGLRDYGTAMWEGGDPTCDHKGNSLASAKSTLAGYTSENVKIRMNSIPFKALCGKCGAIRVDQQIGLEATPDGYVAKLVEVFREVRRILRSDGILFLNLGDAYAGHNIGGFRPGNEVKNGGVSNKNGVGFISGMKPKDLIGLPWMVAFALRADGWWLRQDNIWAKRNCMPESVQDRTTRAHEYIFMLTKSERYFYDAVAIEEDGEIAAGTRAAKGSNVRSEIKGVNGRPPEYYEYTGKRNKRSVWWMATQPFPEAHFAVYPAELAETCIKAGTSERGCCPGCGAPWARVTERAQQPSSYAARKYDEGDPLFRTKRNLGARYQAQLNANPKATVGWQPTCECYELRCRLCASVLDSNDARISSTTEPMRPMREIVFNKKARDEVLQQSVLACGNPSSSRSGLPLVQDDVSANLGSNSDVLKTVCPEMERSEPQHNEGLDDHEHGISFDFNSIASECEQLRLCAGTSLSNGKEARTASDQERGGTPQERRSSGQQNPKPSIDGQTRTRRRAKTRLHGDVPPLQESVSDARQCPHCGSRLERTAPLPRPCVILDPFFGSGTTGLIADRLGRDCIGIELNKEYVRMAEARVRRDAPLFAEVAAE